VEIVGVRSAFLDIAGALGEAPVVRWVTLGHLQIVIKASAQPSDYFRNDVISDASILVSIRYEETIRKDYYDRYNYCSVL
jgi:hypothetical protein